MRILVDTSVWSIALRRPKGIEIASAQKHAVDTLTDLVRDGRAALMGAIRQELLSGIKSQDQFVALKTALASFDDFALGRQDYELAAEFFNTCRAQGIQGSNTDFLICAVSANHGLPILSLDQDFENYRKCLPIRLLGY